MAARAAAAPKESKNESAPVEERIRKRAYEIYAQRGGQDGSAVDDWLQAEAEIGQQEREETQTSGT